MSKSDKPLQLIADVRFYAKQLLGRAKWSKDKGICLDLMHTISCLENEIRPKAKLTPQKKRQISRWKRRKVRGEQPVSTVARKVGVSRTTLYRAVRRSS